MRRTEREGDVPASDAGPFHVGLTPERVIDAAVELTRDSHLMSWSIRDLAGALGVAPSVIYHHVGGKELLSRSVVARMVSQIDPPPLELPWQDWFRTLLLECGPLAAAYPGTAKWMLMHGPTIAEALPVLEAGLAVLQRAGFGAQTNVAFSMLLNNAMLTVSLSDDRLQHEDDGPRDHATMMAEFQRLPTLSPAVLAMGEAFIRPFADGVDTPTAGRWAYYRRVVDVTIAGIETLFAPAAPTP